MRPPVLVVGLLLLLISACANEPTEPRTTTTDLREVLLGDWQMLPGQGANFFSRIVRYSRFTVTDSLYCLVEGPYGCRGRERMGGQMRNDTLYIEDIPLTLLWAKGDTACAVLFDGFLGADTFVAVRTPSIPYEEWVTDVALPATKWTIGCASGAVRDMAWTGSRLWVLSDPVPTVEGSALIQVDTTTGSCISTVNVAQRIRAFGYGFGYLLTTQLYDTRSIHARNPDSALQDTVFTVTGLSPINFITFDGHQAWFHYSGSSDSCLATWVLGDSVAQDRADPYALGTLAFGKQHLWSLGGPFIMQSPDAYIHQVDTATIRCTKTYELMSPDTTTSFTSIEFVGDQLWILDNWGRMYSLVLD